MVFQKLRKGKAIEERASQQQYLHGINNLCASHWVRRDLWQGCEEAKWPQFKHGGRLVTGQYSRDGGNSFFTERRAAACFYLRDRVQRAGQNSYR